MSSLQRVQKTAAARAQKKGSNSHPRYDYGFMINNFNKSYVMGLQTTSSIKSTHVESCLEGRINSLEARANRAAKIVIERAGRRR